MFVRKISVDPDAVDAVEKLSQQINNMSEILNGFLDEENLGYDFRGLVGGRNADSSHYHSKLVSSYGGDAVSVSGQYVRIAQDLRVDGDLLASGNIGTLSDPDLIQIVDDNIRINGHVGIGGTYLDNYLLVSRDWAVDYVGSYHGFYTGVERTGGVCSADNNDELIGATILTTLNNAGNEHGDLIGTYNQAVLSDGDIGDAGQDRYARGTYTLLGIEGGKVYGDVIGSEVTAYLYNSIEVTGDFTSSYIYVESTAGTTISGNVYGAHIYSDMAGTVTGTTYGVYVETVANLDYCFYAESGDAYIPGDLELYQTAADSILTLTAAHATDYDPQIHFKTDASPTVKYVMGVDSTTDAFVLGYDTTVGGVVAGVYDLGMGMTSAGHVGYGAAPLSNARAMYASDETNLHGQMGVYFRGRSYTTANGNYRSDTFYCQTEGWVDAGRSNGSSTFGFTIYALARNYGNLGGIFGADINFGKYQFGGTVTNAMGIRLAPLNTAGTTTNMYGIYCGALPAGGTVTNQWFIKSFWDAPLSTVGHIQIDADSRYYYCGAAQDMGMWYDGTHGHINPQLVGSGDLYLDAGDLILSGGGIVFGSAAFEYSGGILYLSASSGINDPVSMISYLSEGLDVREITTGDGLKLKSKDHLDAVGNSIIVDLCSQSTVVGGMRTEAVSVGSGAADHMDLVFRTYDNPTLSDVFSMTYDGYFRAETTKYRRVFQLPVTSLNPGASGATWVDATSNTLCGYKLDAASETLEANAAVRADWDAASDLELNLTFTVNLDNSGGNAGDTVDVKVIFYYKAAAETATRTQTVEVATVIGACAQWTQFDVAIPVDYNIGGGNNVAAGDRVSMIINLETDTSEVDDITINDASFNYDTKHVGIESGDV